MIKHYLTMLAVAATALSVSACTPEQKTVYSPPVGDYVETTSSTDANGTTTNTKDSTKVTVNKKGHKKIVTKSKTTVDPKGLMNKTTTEQSDHVTEQK